MAKKKKVEKRGKKPHKNKPTSKKYLQYKMEGSILKKGKHCPRCGPGYFLMNTNNRDYCGNCHYTEFKISEKK